MHSENSTQISVSLIVMGREVKGDFGTMTRFQHLFFGSLPSGKFAELNWLILSRLKEYHICILYFLHIPRRNCKLAL